MEDPTSVWEHCVNGLNVPSNDNLHLQLFIHAIEQIATNLNRFNIDRHICGQKGHCFDGCTQLKNTNVEQAYIRSPLLIFFFFFCKKIRYYN